MASETIIYHVQVKKKTKHEGLHARLSSLYYWIYPNNDISFNQRDAIQPVLRLQCDAFKNNTEVQATHAYWVWISNRKSASNHWWMLCSWMALTTKDSFNPVWTCLNNDASQSVASLLHRQILAHYKHQRRLSGQAICTDDFAKMLMPFTVIRVDLMM